MQIRLRVTIPDIRPNKRILPEHLKSMRDDMQSRMVSIAISHLLPEVYYPYIQKYQEDEVWLEDWFIEIIDLPDQPEYWDKIEPYITEFIKTMLESWSRAPGLLPLKHPGTLTVEVCPNTPPALVVKIPTG